MNRASATLLAFVSLVGLVAAQQPDRFDAHCADIVILQSKPIQAELGISQHQRDLMNVDAQHHKKELSDLKKKVAGTKADPNPELMRDYAELKGRVISRLSSAQLRRLRELTIQHIGLVSLCDPIVGRRIGLSDIQMKSLRTTYDEGYREFGTVEQNSVSAILAPYKNRTPKTEAEKTALTKEVQAKLKAAKAQIEPRLDKIRESYDKRMRGVLTSKQLSAYNSLRGKPFKP